MPAGLPGIDLQASTLKNRPALFMKGLKIFQENQHSFNDNFKNALRNNDMEAATRQAHTLKGQAATFGALNLQQSALALEMACQEKQTDVIEKQLKAVLDDLQIVLDGIDSVLSN